MTRIIVAGGRDFEDYPYLCEKMDSVLQEIGDDIEIVSGHAKGADSLGERYGRSAGSRWLNFGQTGNDTAAMPGLCAISRCLIMQRKPVRSL